jgi:hypothetical protein
LRACVRLCDQIYIDRVAPYAGYVALASETERLFGSAYAGVKDYLLSVGHPEPRVLKRVRKTRSVSSGLEVVPHQDGRFGNSTRLINDPIRLSSDKTTSSECDDESESPEDSDGDSDDDSALVRVSGSPHPQKANCAFVTVWFDGWPYAFVVLFRGVAARDELLISYGRDFWGSRLPTLTASDSESKQADGDAPSDDDQDQEDDNPKSAKRQRLS